MTPAELESRIRALTLLMYDTSVSRPTLREKVEPYLAPDIKFLDPWLRAQGASKFKVGLHGFHCVIRFDFDIAQMSAVISDDGKRGRVVVEGTMNLRQLVVYTYPLRTILVYEVDLVGGELGLQVTKLEEMWSFGDMIANAPLLGSFYDGVFRPAAGYFFTAAFWLSCALFGKKAERAPA
jgi:hypothetical protein